jgi:nitrate reductase cytochrome c-type subunit
LFCNSGQHGANRAKNRTNDGIKHDKKAKKKHEKNRKNTQKNDKKHEKNVKKMQKNRKKRDYFDTPFPICGNTPPHELQHLAGKVESHFEFVACGATRAKKHNAIFALHDRY